MTRFLQISAGGATLLAGMLLLSACTPPTSSTPAAPPADPALASWARGKHLYYTRCASCHSPEPVADYTPSQWREIVPRMARLTKLNAQDEASVLKFVLGEEF